MVRATAMQNLPNELPAETRAQLDLVRSLGCPVGQGHLLARPLGAAELAGWIDANAPAPVR